MKKNYVMIGITCALLLISGICYSCSYEENQSHAELITTRTDASDTSQYAEGLTGADERENSDKVSGLEKEKTSAHSEASMKIEASKENTKASGVEVHIIYVHICGEVINPGVYEADEGARVIDLVALAGGLTKEAAGDYINQAVKVSDGQRIYIPSKEEVKELPFTSDTLTQESNSPEASTDEKRININLADAKELMELPGIGEAKAASIIEYRGANGSFQTIEELMKIPGIKEGLFNKVSPYITVR